jgi:hypothetical protein
MKRVCAWCQRPLNDEPENGELISHGICEYCARTLYQEKKGASLGNAYDSLAAMQLDAERQKRQRTAFWWVELLKGLNLRNRLRQ